MRGPPRPSRSHVSQTQTYTLSPSRSCPSRAGVILIIGISKTIDGACRMVSAGYLLRSAHHPNVTRFTSRQAGQSAQHGGQDEVRRAAGRGLEIAKIALVDDHGADVAPVGEILDPKKLAEAPARALLLESQPQVLAPVACGGLSVAVVRVDLPAPEGLER